MSLNITTQVKRIVQGSAALALTGLLAAWPFAAAPGQSADGQPDCRQTLRVRQAFLQDPTLAPLNLGVSVKLSTAVLWGDVNDAGAMQQAEIVARRVPGILGVQNNLRVLPADDPLRELAKQTPRRPMLDTPRVSLLQRPTGTLASQPEANSAVTLLPPMTLLPAAKPDDLSASIDKLTGSDPRFRGLRPRIDGGVVHLTGSAGRWEDVMELAQRISHVGGVERVILGVVQMPR